MEHQRFVTNFCPISVYPFILLCRVALGISYCFAAALTDILGSLVQRITASVMLASVQFIMFSTSWSSLRLFWFFWSRHWDCPSCKLIKINPSPQLKISCMQLARYVWVYSSPFCLNSGHSLEFGSCTGGIWSYRTGGNKLNRPIWTVDNNNSQRLHSNIYMLVLFLDKI